MRRKLKCLRDFPNLIKCGNQMKITFWFNWRNNVSLSLKITCTAASAASTASVQRSPTATTVNIIITKSPEKAKTRSQTETRFATFFGCQPNAWIQITGKAFVNIIKYVWIFAPKFGTAGLWFWRQISNQKWNRNWVCCPFPPFLTTRQITATVRAPL